MPHSAAEIQFYDTCVRVGRSRAPDPLGNVTDVRRLLACMEKHHISHAAVEHAVALEGSPRLGHELLANEIAGQENLRSAWHLMPAVSPRIEKAVTDPAEILAQRVALGRVDAKDFCLGKGDFAGFGPVLEACQQVHLPVFLDFRRQGDFILFDLDICRRWPGIPFVLEGVGNYPLHKIVWGLKEYANLYASTVGMSGFNEVAFLCEEVGVSRILFGSNWPAANIGLNLGAVLFAGVSTEDRQQIAAGNFMRLLAGIGL